MTCHHSTHFENPWSALVSLAIELAGQTECFHIVAYGFSSLTCSSYKLQWFTLFIPGVKLIQFVPLKFIKKIFFWEVVAQTLFFTQKYFAIGITYSNLILKKLFHIFFSSGIFAPPLIYGNASRWSRDQTALYRANNKQHFKFSCVWRKMMGGGKKLR